MNLPTIWPQFFTATIQNWKPLLNDDEYKDIITGCLKFMVDDKRIELNAFVVMSNHFHLIWQPLGQYTLTQIQSTLLTNTAKAIKKKLAEKNPDLLEQLKVKNCFSATSPAGDVALQVSCCCNSPGIVA